MSPKLLALQPQEPAGHHRLVAVAIKIGELGEEFKKKKYLSRKVCGSIVNGHP